MLQGFIRGGCPDAVGIETLVEDESLVIWNVVQENLVTFDVDLAHSHVGTYLVYDRTISGNNLIGNVVEEGILRRPQAGLLYGEEDCGVGAGALDRLLGDHLGTILHDDLKGVGRVVSKEFRMDDDHALVDVGDDMDPAETLHVDSFHPDGLPDSGGTGVVAVMGCELEGLLSGALHSATDIAGCLNDE